MDEICQPVETKFGVIQGRTSLSLDFFDFDCEENTLMLRGGLCLTNRFMKDVRAQADKDEVFYSITFRGVMAFSVLELDSWLHFHHERNFASEFDEVLHSRWQAKMITTGKVTTEHKHYAFATYDDVIDVICVDFQMSFRQEV